MAGKMALGPTEARCWEGACAPGEARMDSVIPRGEGLSGRAVWAEVAAGGDRRALRLHAQPDGAATAELQPSSLSILPAPLGIKRCAMAKATDSWSDLALVFWFACLLPLGPARVAAGKSEPVQNLSYLDDSVPSAPLPRSHPDTWGVSLLPLDACLHHSVLGSISIPMLETGIR